MDATQAFRDLMGPRDAPAFERLGVILAVSPGSWTVARDGLDQTGLRPMAGLEAKPGDTVLCRRLPDTSWIVVGVLQ